MVIKQEFTFPSSDGVHTVAAAWWRPEGPPRGVVQLVHGISEHIGRYDSFARFLAEHGFARKRATTTWATAARRGTPWSSAGSPTGTAGSTW